MTIAAGYVPDSYTENGATTLRAVNFPFIDDVDLVVTRTSVAGVASTLELGVDYTVTGGAYAVGSITVADAGEVGSTLEIARLTPRVQEGDYGDDWPTDTLEQNFDRLTMIAQELAYEATQLAADLARAVLVPDGEDGLTLPEIADRAGLYLKFDEDGLPIPGDPAEDAVTPNFTFVIEILEADEEGFVTPSGTFPDITLTIGIPRGTAGLTGALANGTYGDIVVTDDGDTLTIGANTVTMAKLVAAASAGFIGATGAGNYSHRTIAQVTAALDTFTSLLKGLVPASGGGTANFLRADGTFAGLLTAVPIACSDESTALAAGNGKVTFRMPFGMSLVAVRASLTTAQTGNGGGGPLTVDINEGGVSILSTKLTFNNGEKTTTTASVPAVVSDAALADDAEITIDIDQIGDGTAKGLKVYLIGRIT